MKKKILFICHSTYFGREPFDPNYGITFGFLNHYFKDDYYIIRHSLYKGGETRLYKGNDKQVFYKIPIIGLMPNIIRYIFEAIFNFIIILLNKPEIVVCIDPLSSAIPTFFRTLKYVKKIYFITPDFTLKRFENSLLNKIYFLMDRFCTLNCDSNIVCSQTVIDFKRKLYNNEQTKYFHMPNIPNPWIIENFTNSKKIENRIIYVGNVSRQIDFKYILKIYSDIKKEEKSLSINIVGEGDFKNELINFVNENKIDDVVFSGQLSYEDTLKEISVAEFGVALYNGAFNYDQFRDSCKIREYQALLTIPITTPVVKSNTSEIKKFNSGIVISSNSALSEVLLKLTLDKNYKKSLIFNMKINNNIYLNKYNEMFKLISNF